MEIQQKIGNFLLATTGLCILSLTYHATNTDPQTKALHNAIDNRDLKTIESLFHLREKGVLPRLRDLNPEREHDGLTPLQRAISIGDTEILELLLKSGLNPYGKNQQYISGHPFNIGAVTHAILYTQHDEDKKIEMIKLLQKYGGDINDYSASGMHIPIFAAIESNNVGVAAYLIREGVNTTVKTRGPKYNRKWYEPCDAAMVYLEKPDDDELIKLYQHDKSARNLLARYQQCGKRDDIHCELIKHNAANERVPGKDTDLLSYVVKKGQCESLKGQCESLKGQCESLSKTCSAGHSK